MSFCREDPGKISDHLGEANGDPNEERQKKDLIIFKKLKLNMFKYKCVAFCEIENTGQ